MSDLRPNLAKHPLLEPSPYRVKSMAYLQGQIVRNAEKPISECALMGEDRLEWEQGWKDLDCILSNPSVPTMMHVVTTFAECADDKAYIERLEELARKCLDGVPDGQGDSAGLLSILAGLESEALKVLKSWRRPLPKRGEQSCGR